MNDAMARTMDAEDRTQLISAPLGYGACFSPIRVGPPPIACPWIGSISHDFRRRPPAGQEIADVDGENPGPMKRPVRPAAGSPRDFPGCSIAMRRPRPLALVKAAAGMQNRAMDTRQPAVPSPTSVDEPAPPAADREAWHTLTVAEVAARLRTDAGRGLAEAEAARRLRQHGPNALAETPGRSPLAIFAAQFRSLIVLLLVAATAVAFAMGETIEAIAILDRHRPERGHRVPDGMAGRAGADGAPEAGRRGGPGDPRRGGARGPRGRAGARGRRRHRGRGAGARRRPGGRGRATAGRGGGADGRIARRGQGHRPDRRPRRAAGRPRRHGLHGHDDHRRPRPADRHGHRRADRDGQDRRPDRRGRHPGHPPGAEARPARPGPGRGRAGPLRGDRRRRLPAGPPLPAHAGGRHLAGHRRGPRGPARRGDDDAGDGHAAHGPDAGAGAPAPRRRDARLDHGHLHRQDRDPDQERDDRARLRPGGGAHRGHRHGLCRGGGIPPGRAARRCEGRRPPDAGPADRCAVQRRRHRAPRRPERRARRPDRGGLDRRGGQGGAGPARPGSRLPEGRRGPLRQRRRNA